METLPGSPPPGWVALRQPPENSTGSSWSSSTPTYSDISDLIVAIHSIDGSMRKIGALLEVHPASKPDPGYCSYHKRFGEHARNCRQPCKWQSQHYSVTRQQGNEKGSSKPALQSANSPYSARDMFGRLARRKRTVGGKRRERRRRMKSSRNGIPAVVLSHFMCLRIVEGGRPSACIKLWWNGGM
ncbi:hypothetical protein Pcinc_001428 [Petrolisthes cinctipes]|uniref:Uncharacterized protein n=1 Tax=Petrolisthes cinctipes TaxID=88211 RepID=A0AAE1GLC7_PETCI|nr:hypothetical protein Pcinc_001428 [Petrolisthes cinctipes]